MDSNFFIGSRWRLLLPLLLVGCSVGPHLAPPLTVTPEEWKTASTDHSTTAEKFDFWWQLFRDPLLDNLEERAVADNNDLYILLQRVFEARALAAAERATLFPHIFFNPSYENRGVLFEANFPTGLSSSTPMESTPPFRTHQLQYLFPLNLNYEVDLWGKLANRSAAASCHAQAQADGYSSALLTLTADLAATYFHLRTLDAQLNLQRAAVEARSEHRRLTLSRYRHGLVTYLDVAQSEVQVGKAEALFSETLRLRSLAENQIAILIGVSPTTFKLESNPIELPPPKVPAGIPATLLLKRPDIAQAAKEMAGGNARLRASYGELLPSISLTGALGYLSPDFSLFLKSLSRYWMIGAHSSQVVFDGGRNCANVGVAWARFNEASGKYRQQILIAFKEVEDALINIEQHARQSEQLQRAAEAAKVAAEISLQRYKNGATFYVEVVVAERELLQTEVEWLTQLGAQYSASIQLIKSLGGSWEIDSH